MTLKDSAEIWQFDLGLPSFQNCENKLILIKPFSLWCFLMETLSKRSYAWASNPSEQLHGYPTDIQTEHVRLDKNYSPTSIFFFFPLHLIISNTSHQVMWNRNPRVILDFTFSPTHTWLMMKSKAPKLLFYH